MKEYEVAVIGAGIAGIATAYYLTLAGAQSVVLIDSGQPMALTSAQSGENYRNWWPHPVMTRFTDDSIDLMEEIATQTDNRINITRRGYVLATRSNDINGLIENLFRGYGDSAASLIRVRESNQTGAYDLAGTRDWASVPDGVDVLGDPQVIRASFPSFDKDVASVIHIRRAGDISGQQLGTFMLEHFRQEGGTRITDEVVGIDTVQVGFVLRLQSGVSVRAARIVNAAGPFLSQIAAMLGETLPVQTVLQQKIAFEDTAGAIPRDMPFAIDLDAQTIDWSDEERDLIGQMPGMEQFTQQMPGSIHCRPDGGLNGRWVKLGWAYNDSTSEPSREPQLDQHFPEIVLHGAARLNPALKAYYGHLPRNRVHYGGYYALTEENWPLIGPTETEGSFVNGALSGFGTMAACQAGRLCANWIVGAAQPDYAQSLSLDRYHDAELMRELRDLSDQGIL